MIQSTPPLEGADARALLDQVEFIAPKRVVPAKGTNMADQNPTLRQWILDMTGPEDAWAREQYAAIVEAAMEVLRRVNVAGAASGGAALEALRTALVLAGEESD